MKNLAMLPAALARLRGDPAPSPFRRGLRRRRIRRRADDAGRRLQRIPTVIFEPNAEPASPIACLARWPRASPPAIETWPSAWGASRLTGCPVRAEFFRFRPRDPAPPFRLLITGGSQGARAINRAVVDALDLLAARKNRLIVHQTGERDYNAVRAAYARREFLAEVAPFLTNMAERFAQADLIVCRAGAITVAEIAAAGRAAIFIPFGAATDSHQLRNAQEMVERAARAA